MKGRIDKIFLIAALLVVGAAGSVAAQNAGMSDSEVTVAPDNNSERAIFAPGDESRYVTRPAGLYAPSDSVTLQMQDFPMQRAQKPADKSAPKKDDSILTFNFLYYIIQKYKLQDIID